MKLSNETLTVLKNFATINDGIEFKQGTKLKTVSSSKTVLAEANLKDAFTDEFCVDDLNEFLSVHTLFGDKAELVFDEHNINFQSGRNKLKYRKTAKNMIVTPPEKTLTLPSEDVKFTLSNEDLDSIIKTAKVLSSTHIAIQSEGDNIEVVTYNAELDTAHINSMEIGEGNGKKYKAVFSIDNIKLIPGSYEVTICFKGLSHFKNTKDDIQYWIASEAKHSKFGE
jgi:hypothetical protein